MSFYGLQIGTYPEEAQVRHQQGQVNVAVLIDQHGNPESYAIGISSGASSLDAEALRVVKLTNRNLSSEKEGLKVKSLLTFERRNFHLRNEEFR